MMNKMMKKIAVAFAAATMMMTAVTATTAFANDGTGIETMNGVSCAAYDATLYVTALSGANVRTAPSTDARILHSLPYGQKVIVCGKTSNGWYQLVAEDTTYFGQTMGYIAGDLLSENRPAEKQQEAIGYASGITADGQLQTNNAGTPSYVKTSTPNIN